ncbi:unnamed protein product [Lactuca saligna]|uniref:Anaphase-promoting complex subunit 4 WD40 domain-containing protein n=1 Tax=Lactuca saligna TaxID=75948 RepID=A0AA36ENS6_LACSI|nr:unnamed protein product [Lactuca saligna]
MKKGTVIWKATQVLTLQDSDRQHHRKDILTRFLKKSNPCYPQHPIYIGPPTPPQAKVQIPLSHKMEDQKKFYGVSVKKNVIVTISSCAWVCYESDGEIEALLEWLEDDDAKEKQLKENIKKWQRNKSTDLNDDHIVGQVALQFRSLAHQGCVNTIAWNSKGSLLISGSDDAHVNLWSYESRKLLHSIDSGHRNNIFCTEFVPKTSDELVAFGAGDTDVRIFNLSRTHEDTASNLSAHFQCHSRIVKKLAVEPGNPNVVWSASEDATLRQHDLREVTSCPPVENSASRPLSELRTAEELEAAAREKGEFKNQESEGEIHPNDGLTEAK